jgi:hypothetical protein
MNAERMRVLELLEQGKITAAEAAELLHALEDKPPEPPDPPRTWFGGGGKGRDRPRWFRVRVTDTATGRAKANLAIPYGMVDFGLRFAPGHLRLRRHGIDHMDDLLEALRSGKRGTLYDVTDKGERERIEIIVE